MFGPIVFPPANYVLGGIPQSAKRACGKSGNSLAMWNTYILRNDCNKRFYIGVTNNIKRRVAEHNRSKKRSVTHFGNYYLVYSEQFSTRNEATQRERKLKSYKGGNAFKKLLREKADIIL